MGVHIWVPLGATLLGAMRVGKQTHSQALGKLQLSSAFIGPDLWDSDNLPAYTELLSAKARVGMD